MYLLEFCAKSSPVWQLVGKILVVFKIVIPILLIIFGMIDLGKAVIASDEKAIKEATNSIIRRLIAAVVIFFVPTLVGAVFGLIGSFNDDKTTADYDICRACITKPNGTTCNTNAEANS